MLSSKEIRQQFIEFFVSKGHTYIPSSPVIPIDDDTLLFANAGMNQFKSIFLGLKDPDILRAVNSQKCIRAGGKHNDLEDVGKDGYHHTFFEMLGNWSFGDYYKEDAILWAWELFTEIWRLPKEKLHATVYQDDSEAFELWKTKTDINPNHITYHGDKDNFWEMGETGPCGPCSEIHLDRGIEYCDKRNDPTHVCIVNGDCHRYIELWNLVFIQYYRDDQGVLNSLKSRYVDTGAGLERICQIIQGKGSNYETDLFMPILERIAELSGKKYSEESGISHRVIADHIRTLCFSLADGGFPSNEGRGYVLRRILRRAARHGRLLGFSSPFMWMLVDTVTDIMGDHYRELLGKSAYIKMIIKAEEERFNQTLDKGLERFNEIITRVDGLIIPGSEAFMLYDTFGFPLDLTQLLAEEKGLGIDLVGFDSEMKAQKDRARSASKFSLEIDESEWIELNPVLPTEFIGYNSIQAEARILRYSFGSDSQIKVMLDKTPFYAESGGQLSDTGKLTQGNLVIRIDQVKKMDEYFIHIGKLISGVLDGDTVNAVIDVERRIDIARNHTATHLLHKTLQAILGDHVQQKGSLVTPEYLRFDFTHFQSLSSEQLALVQDHVNQQILNNAKITIEFKTIDEARNEGAVALFGEKYGDIVRVVSVDDYSKELCGGTHVSATGNIGLFKILTESSSAAGIRRIEAITGKAVLRFMSDLENSQLLIAEKLNCLPKQVPQKIESMLSSLHATEKDLHILRQKALTSTIDTLISTSTKHGDTKLINQVVSLSDVESLRHLGDLLKEQTRSTISVLFAIIDSKISILCVVSKDIQKDYHAGKIVGKIAELLDGKGGGRPDTAMAGGKNLDALDHVRQEIERIVFP